MNVDGLNRFITQSNRGSAKMSDILKFLQKKRKVNVILRNGSCNMRVSIECKTLFVSEWDAVMKLTAVGKYHFSIDIRNFKNIKSPPPPPPPFSLLHTIFKDECMCLQDE